MKTVTYWQTFGGTVMVPDDKVDAFEEAVANNSTDVEGLSDIMKTFNPSHYEGQIVDVE